MNKYVKRMVKKPFTIILAMMVMIAHFPVEVFAESPVQIEESAEDSGGSENEATDSDTGNEASDTESNIGDEDNNTEGNTGDEDNDTEGNTGEEDNDTEGNTGDEDNDTEGNIGDEDNDTENNTEGEDNEGNIEGEANGNENNNADNNGVIGNGVDNLPNLLNVLAAETCACVVENCSVCDGGNCTEIVASFGDDDDKKSYCTISCALANTTGEVTITLEKDTTENIVISSGRTVNLILNNETTITNDAESKITHTIENKGVLTIGGTGTVDNISHAKGALYNEAGATATLNGGTFHRSSENGNSSSNSGGNSWYNIANYGTMTIEEGVVVEQDGHFSSMVANVGKTNDIAKLTINGGSFSGGLNTIKNDDNGDLTITGGEFKNVSDAPLLNAHIAVVEGGTFDGTGAGNVIKNQKFNYGEKNDGNLTINGGTFIIGKDGGAIIAAPYNGAATWGQDPGTVVVNDVKGMYFKGGKLLDNSRAAEGKEDGILKISGGYFDTEDPDEYLEDGHYRVKSDEDEYTYMVTEDPAKLTVEGIVIKDKVYDGTSKAEFDLSDVKLTGDLLVDGDKVELDLTNVITAVFDNAGVGNNKKITITGLNLTSDSSRHYELDEIEAKANIEKFPLKFGVDDISITDITDNIYTVEAEPNESVVGNEEVTITGKGELSGEKTLEIVWELGGKDKGNYELHDSIPTSMDIKILEIESGIVIKNREYDGSDKAEIDLDNSDVKLKGVLTADVNTVKLDLTNAKAVFSDKNAGDSKTVTISGFELTGDSASYYLLKSDKYEATANISKLTLQLDENSIFITDVKDDIYTVKADATNIIADEEITITGEGVLAENKETLTLSKDKWVLGGKDKDNYMLGSIPESIPVSVEEPDDFDKDSAVTNGNPEIEIQEDAKTILDELNVTEETVKEAMEKTDADMSKVEQFTDIAEKIKENEALYAKAAEELQVITETNAEDIKNEGIKLIIEPYVKIDIATITNTETKSELALNITPRYRVIAVLKNTEAKDVEINTNAVQLDDQPAEEINDQVEVKLELPKDLVEGLNLHTEGAPVFARHTKGNLFYYYDVAVVLSGDNYKLSFSTQHGFSPFAITVDERTATVTYKYENGTDYNKAVYSPKNVWDTLPTGPNKSGYTFSSWKFGELGNHKSLTDDLLSKLSVADTVTATPNYTRNSTDSNDSDSDSSDDSDSGSTKKVASTSESDTIQKKVEKLIKDGKRAELTIGTSETSIALTPATVDALVNAEEDLTVKNGDVSMTVRYSSLQAIRNGKHNVIITIKPLKKSEYNATDLVSGMYDIKITVNGKEATEFNLPILIQFKLSDASLKDIEISKLTGARFTDKSIDRLGGQYDEKSKIFSFYTSSLSKYGIISADDLVSLVMSLNSSGYTLNNVPYTSDVAPVIINDRTLVPVRLIAESFGADVEWNGNTQMATINFDGNILYMTINQRLEGMDVPATIVNDRTMVPLRFIAEYFGANVVYEEDTRMIYIYR